MAMGGHSDSIDLKGYQWKHRLLFLFAPSGEDPSYLLLRTEIERQAREVLDRDLLVFHVLDKGESRLGMDPLNSGQVLSLRKQMAVPPGKFMIILIGKDGGEKIREGRFVGLTEIMGTIDAMPMRQQEMRKKQYPR